MLPRITALTVVVGMTTTVALTLAADEPLKKQDVPAPVLASVAKKYPSGVMKAFEKEVEEGKTQYEVKVVAEGRTSDIIVAPDGTLLLEETTIPASELPATVSRALAASSYGKAKVVRVERINDLQASGAPSFEVVVNGQGKQRELIFDSTGKLRQDEEKMAGDKD
jgi:hypothetical protein